MDPRVIGEPTGPARSGRPDDWLRDAVLRTAMPAGDISKILEPQNVGHRIKARFLATRPQRRVQRPARKDHAILGAMRELDALGGTGEDHRMVTDHRAATQRRKADIAGRTWPGHAVAATRRAFRQIDTTPFGRRTAE